MRKQTQLEKLCEHADEVIEMILCAKSYNEIKEKFGVSHDAIARFISESEHSPRAREAQKKSADLIAEKAERILLQLEKGNDTAEITRARELAHHYRWLAAKKNPSAYSEKVQQDVKISHQDDFVLKKTKSKETSQKQRVNYIHDAKKYLTNEIEN